MMKNHDNQFQPESVDADIDALLHIQAQAEITEHKQVPLLRALHEQYLDDPEVLERAWKRIAQQLKGTEQQTVLEIQDYQIAKGNRHMQDQAISRKNDKGKNILQRLPSIGSAVIAALLIASVIMVFIYHQQTPSSSHPSPTGGQHHQTQSTTHQTPAPGTKVPGPAAREITIKQIGSVIQVTNPNGQKSTLTPSEDYTFQTGQRVSVSYAAQPWQHTFGNNTLKWYQNDTLYIQQNPTSTSPFSGPGKGTSMYTEGVLYTTPGSDKVEIYWGTQLAWTIYFAVK